MSNNTILKHAVAAALAVSSASALAYLPSSNTDADVVLYWGGATASTLSAQELTVNSVCDTDVHLLYVRAGGTGTAPDAPGNDWAVACRTAATGATKTGIANNKRLLVIKRDRGGSGVGVGPLQTKASDPASGQITFQTFNSTTCSANPVAGTAGAPVINAPGVGAITLKGCSVASTTNAYTEMGTADIEANKFISINTPIVDNVGLPYRTESDRAFAEEYALAGLMFNHPVTLQLFQLLQRVQFDASSVCHPDNAGYAVDTADTTDRPDTDNGQSEACMPSLSREQINGLLTGQIFSWDQLLDKDGNPIVTGGNLTVQVCRRVDGSGTQATANFWTSSFACDPNLVDNSTDIIAPLKSSTPGVFENSGSGDVSNCLRDINNNVQTTFPNVNRFAIGNLSVEGRNNDNSLPWRYIKIDGVAPTLKNAHAGKYSFWAQQSCQRRGEQLPYNTAVGADDTVANKAAIFEALCGPASTNGLNSIATLTKLNNEQNPTNCANGTQLNRCGSFYTFGRSGWLATPTTDLLYDNVLAETTRPVNAFTREVSTGKTNVCQTPVRATEGDNLFNGVIVE